MLRGPYCIWTGCSPPCVQPVRQAFVVCVFLVQSNCGGLSDYLFGDGDEEKEEEWKIICCALARVLVKSKKKNKVVGLVPIKSHKQQYYFEDEDEGPE